MRTRDREGRADARPSPARSIWRPIAAGLVFYAGARIGSVLVFPDSVTSLVWPPAGLTLALALAWGPRIWPGVLVGGFVHLAPTLLAGGASAAALAAILGVAASNVVSVLLGEGWIRRSLRGADPIANARGVLAIALAGGAAAQAVAATVGAGTLWLTGLVPAEALGVVWLTWWLSNVVSVLVLTPPCLAWRPPWDVRLLPSHAGAVAAALAGGYLVFGWLGADTGGYVEYLTILLVIGAAFQLGVRGATLATLVLSAFAVASVASGRGPLSTLPMTEQILLLDLYVATLALTGTSLAAVLAERERHAASAARGEALLRAILRASPVPLAWSEPSGRVEFWSPSVEALFGYAAREMPDEAAWYRLAYPDPAYRQRVLAAWEERVAEAQRTGRPLRPLEVEVRCKDGSRKTVEIAGSFADDRLLVLFIDLTARREAEVQREALHEAVARSQRMESVGRLAGGVAHDLNNLLSPILGYADLLLADAPRGSQQAQDLAELRGAAERARDLTRQLLAFGRRQVLVARPTDLRELVCGMVRLLRRTIPEDVRIDLDVSPALGLVRTDPVQLEQVLMNLAVNAQDAMPGGGRLLFRLAEVAVTGHHPDRRRGVLPGRWAMLEVKDSGAGMAPEVLEHVFEPFFTTKSNGERSGLGLAIVDGVLTQHGGHVVVDSAPGQGTAFRIYLPLSDGGDAAPGPEHAAAGGEGTILLAEDESGVRAVTARMLERLGYRVLAAGDAGACERMITAERGPIDLLLTDVVMPDVNGPQLHERLSALQPGLRVLYMSGYAAEVVSGRGILDQGVPILQKPFTSAALGTAVRCALAAPAGPR